ncbi:hypothetical protein [Sphingomonas immobilis]|uniref:Uncharacterized protein n=1 Tax=Sphingomonas immobilis TaxID=3063997 RepID=A0ABT8ZVR6_9SPHN|nr:hypothetical protein [Sphingomonas sp. CA1-15]MDO7841307.1 hypothetical protein [Sphingomonas sp. CA1-15]
MRFTDVYILRLGAGITLPSACGGFALTTQPPAVLPVTAFEQGPTFRFVLTPQVWAIGGEIGIGFDGRDGDPSVTGVEVALAKTTGAGAYRFTITQPNAAGTGLDYARLASVAAPVGGVNRQYACLLGIPTTAADLAAAQAGAFPRTVLMATAYLRDGATSRTYTLEHSIVSATLDQTTRRVAITIRLVGTPSGGGTDTDLGRLAATAPLDPATGNFTAALASSDRVVTGTISGRFFGPGAVEIGAVLDGAVADAPGVAGYSFAGVAFGIR